MATRGSGAGPRYGRRGKPKWTALWRSGEKPEEEKNGGRREAGRGEERWSALRPWPGTATSFSGNSVRGG